MENKYELIESDWKLFSELLPSWQEAYMQRLIGEYAEILAGPRDASEKFWELDRRLRIDKIVVGIFAKMGRSMMTVNIANLIKEGAITFENLADFSDELKAHVKFLIATRDL